MLRGYYKSSYVKQYEKGDRLLRTGTCLYTGGLLGDWTTRELHARILARHRLSEDDYTLGQLRYDLGKLRAHGLAERVGRSRRRGNRRLLELRLQERDRLDAP